MGILWLFYYIVEVIGYSEILTLFLLFFAIVLLLSVVLAKISIEPLKEYLAHLKNLSSETLHELNLPISTIKANVSMLKKSSVNERALKRLQRVSSACDMLQSRYSELDYAIKRQTKSVVVEKFNLKDVLSDRVEFLQELYVNVKFTLNLSDIEVNLDRIGFQKVIDNIIQNAIKYSSTSSTVEVSNSDTLIKIKDEGCGLDDVEILKIFEKYYQSDSVMDGYGIGLSMVKRYCDESKIAIYVESKKDVGTTFILDFKGVKSAK